MHYRVLEDVVDQHIIDNILKLYNNNKDKRVVENYMDKLNFPWQYEEVKELKSIIDPYVDTTESIGDNIYQHQYSYFPHVDLSGSYPCVNVLVPLQSNIDQHFVIFDQYVDEYVPKTYLGNFKLDVDFKVNKMQTFMYKDTTVKNLTNKPINDSFYSQYLDYDLVDKELFYGMTGVAVKFKPGNIIMFDSKHIHCTGKMSSDFKIGCSLRFTGTLS